MKTMKGVSIAIFFLVCCVVFAQNMQSLQSDPERDQLEAIEEMSEEVANLMLDFSVAIRKFDTEQVSKFFVDAATLTPLPTEATDLVPEVKWIQRRGWQLASDGPGQMTHKEISQMWDAFLTHFKELEDVRFKVKEATFDDHGTTGTAQIAFYLIGRDTMGQREWVRGTGTITLKRTNAGGWAIREMVILSLQSLVAETDIFSEVSEKAGIAVYSPPINQSQNLSALFMWHGAAAADIDQDGDMDLFVTGDSENYLYLNDGTGRFRDAAADAFIKISPSFHASAPLFVDIDNDGDLDLFISAIGRQMLFENTLVPTGKLAFRDISEASGVAVDGIGYSAVASDVNNDGLVDIYVAGYNQWDSELPNSYTDATNGTPNLLFVNQGNSRFREMAHSLSVDDSRWTYAATFADFDSDGDQDLYLTNDFSGNALYRNEGDRFRDVSAEIGIKEPGNGMGVSFGDYDNDGDLDLHATYMSSTAGNRILGRFSTEEVERLQHFAAGNSLYENLNNGTFQNVSSSAGPFPAGWAWGGGFIDFDNDGWQDLYTANGFFSNHLMKDT